MDTYSIEFTIEGLDKPTYDEIMNDLKNFKRFKDVKIYGSAGSNPKEPETVHGNEAEKEVCSKCSDSGWIDTDENGGRTTCPCHLE